MANSNAYIRLCAVVELRIAHIRKRLAHFACIAAGKGNSSRLIIRDNFIAFISPYGLSQITVMIARSVQLVHAAYLHARRSMFASRIRGIICREGLRFLRNVRIGVNHTRINKIGNWPRSNVFVLESTISHRKTTRIKASRDKT